MDKALLPNAQSWNHYWGLDQTEKFTQISWSKRRIIRILEKYVIKHYHALDAGCGSGFFAQYFCQMGMKTAALDYSDKALEIAKAKTRGQAKIFKKDLLSLSLPEEIEERFDFIFSDGLLEHFPRTDQDKIFRNFYSLLTDNGVLITFVPNRFSPWELIRPFYMPGIEEKPFILRELIHLNQRNGFTIIEKGGLNTVPWAFSPDKVFGPTFGMLLFTISKKK